MRKTTILTIALVCGSLVSQAQISKGSTFLGGSVGFFSNNTEQTYPQQQGPSQENRQSGFSIRPQLGKAIAENRVLGVFLNYGRNSHEQTTGNSHSKSESSGYGGGVFYRQYYPMSRRFYLFGEAAAGVEFSNGKTTSTIGTASYVSSASNSRQVSVSLTPGLSFAASRKLFLETSLNDLFSLAYMSTASKSFGQQGQVLQTADGKSFAASANANGFSGLSVGLRWILPSK